MKTELKQAPADNSKEIWKDVPGYEGYYQASNRGKVRSIDRTIIDKNEIKIHRTGKVLSQNVNKDGYLFVELNKNAKRKLRTVHRIISETFIPNIKNKPEVNHINGNKKNNAISNLEWVTSSENQIHAIEDRLQTIPIGEDSNSAKLTNNEVLEIVCSYRLGIFTHAEIAKAYNISRQVICGILNGRIWSKITGIKNSGLK